MLSIVPSPVLIHPVELLVRAISTQEGELGSHNRNNPGNLRYAGQLGATAPGWDGKGDAPVATFDTWTRGTVALFRQVWLQVDEGQTVRQVVTQYAPPNENDTAKYIADVALWTKLPLDTPVMNLLPVLTRLN